MRRFRPFPKILFINWNQIGLSLTDRLILYTFYFEKNQCFCDSFYKSLVFFSRLPD